MFRLLVVDDEPIERDAIRLLLKRHLPEVDLVGEAGSGRQAVEMVDRLKPDVVLLDIQMPGLDGLEAMREIKARAPETRCMVVSAYDYFHFAQEALHLGADAYLLKPVKRDRMLGALREAGDRIARERRQREEQMSGKERWHRLAPVLEAQLARLLTCDDADAAELAALQESLGLGFQAGFALVGCVAPGSVPDEAVRGTASSGHAADAARRALGDAGRLFLQLAHSLCACAGGWLGDDQIAVFIDQDAADDEYTTRVWSVNLAHRLRDRVKEQTGVRFRVGVGEPYRGARQLHRSYREALLAAADDTVSHKVNHYGDLFRPRARDADGLPGQPGEAARGPAPGLVAREAVDRARRFIAERFAEDLTLESVAAHVMLSPYYFSKVFRQVVGENFVDHVTRVRVEQAKRKLASPEASVKEVCFAVGYHDPNYFSRVFKKVTGRTPTEYRGG